ncbi:DUF736 domain-containing protein [Hirschia litorea]|uniref:DUF736 domain-containing protein n=1 Tax=Hirschia litorea TaxID=1199156 RepID=A0ABW2IPX5_9PROT
MAQIGHFTLKDGIYTGRIRTMSINVEAQILPVKDKPNLDAPDYRVFSDGSELGAGWIKESNSGETQYLALKLDDPNFASPMRAAFFENAKDGTGVMVWSRNPPK